MRILESHSKKISNGKWKKKLSQKRSILHLASQISRGETAPEKRVTGFSNSKDFIKIFAVIFSKFNVKFS